MIHLDQLPVELLSLIVGNVNHKGLFNCALINKRFYAATIPVLWRAPKADDGHSIDRLTRSLVYSLSSIRRHHPVILGHHIRQLDITARDDDALDDAGLMFIVDHAHYLEDLTIHPAHRITDISIQHLSRHCTQLRKLHLYKATITHRSVHYLGQRCRQLRELGLKACHELLPITLLPFAEVPLEHLDLSECRWLTVEDTALDLAALDRLVHLELVCTRTINTKFIEQLLPTSTATTPLPLLTYFAITGWTDISDQVMVPFITSHPRLESLHLLKCGITDLTLDTIATHLPTTLHVLALFSCELITAPAVRRLIRACPWLVMIDLEQCKLLYDDFPELDEQRLAMDGEDGYYVQILGYSEITAIRRDTRGLDDIGRSQLEGALVDSMVMVDEQPVLHASLNTTLSPKTATDSSGTKVISSSTKIQHHWHRSVDKKH
ncbi:hypothetical protein [Absidia glauca]|uniref:F-box domain-containing protein n=1 Tax=Absidia glauca TaxID=4829 RepID=A0A168PEX3_ABSGL|nr:hypothetical protein [Absidia glauca]